MNEPTREEYDVYSSLWKAIKSHEHWYWVLVNLALAPVYLFCIGLILAKAHLLRARRG